MVKFYRSLRKGGSNQSVGLKLLASTTCSSINDLTKYVGKCDQLLRGTDYALVGRAAYNMQHALAKPPENKVFAVRHTKTPFEETPAAPCPTVAGEPATC